MIRSNVLPNLEKLEALLKKQPKATHVYFRREDEETVDIPIGSAIFTIRNNPKWFVEDLATSENAAAPVMNPWQGPKDAEIKKAKEAAAAAPAVTLPPKPSEEEKKDETPPLPAGDPAAPAAPEPAAPTPPEPTLPKPVVPVTPTKPATTRKK